MQRRSVRIRNGGFDIAIEDSGGTGRPCVLLHGRGECSSVWRTLTEAAPSDHRFVTIDFRGHGDSSWDPNGNYDPRTLAGDVFEVLMALNIRQPVLVGHSLGGSVALHLIGMLEQFASGASNKEAGRTLGISPRTIEVHRARIMEKVGAKNAADLVRLVLGHGSGARH